MRIKLVSYDLKNGSAPGTKSKNFKANNTNFNDRKNFSQIKDNRKFQNDRTLSEAEKMARRIDLENMNTKVKNHGVTKSDQLFSGLKAEKEWETDPMMRKMNQLGRYDEGLDESSEDDDDNNREDSSRYFADGHSALKQKKKSLEDMIHESKVKKAKKRATNENDAEIGQKINDTFKETLRFMLPQISASCKALDVKKPTTEAKMDVDFDAEFEMCQMAAKPEPRTKTTMVTTNGLSDKKNDKLVKDKVEKLNEHLKKAGIINEAGETEEKYMNESDLESEEEEDGDDAESSDEEDNNSVEVGEDDSDKEDEDDSDKEDEDDSDEEEEETVPKKTDIQAKSSSVNVNNKRRIESDDSDVDKVCKKAKMDDKKDGIRQKEKIADNKGNKKNSVDCLRVLLQMNLRKEAMLVLCSELDRVESSMDSMEKDSVVKKGILAMLLQEALIMNAPHSYCPELVRYLRSVLTEAARDNEDHWLSINSDNREMKKDQLLHMCTSERDTSLLAISTIFHTVRLTRSVVACNKTLASGRTLFEPLANAIGQLPTELYPHWLKQELENVEQQIRAVCLNPVTVLRVKKVFKIVELLEPDLEDKFDPKKDVRKVLKKKIKNEKKSLRKDIKMSAHSRSLKEMSEARKTSAIRDKKTLAIINNINQI